MSAEGLDLFGPPSDPPISEHLSKEIEAAFRGERLTDGEPVPGCGCERCGRFVFPRPTTCWWCR